MRLPIVVTIVLMISIVSTIEPAFAYSNSSIVCTDNSTLTEVLTVTLLNASNSSQTLNASSYLLQMTCQYGCDNVTKTCSPDPFSQNVLMFVIFIGFCGVLVLIYKVF